jgi:hypothetical protein
MDQDILDIDARRLTAATRARDNSALGSWARTHWDRVLQKLTANMRRRSLYEQTVGSERHSLAAAAAVWNHY